MKKEKMYCPTCGAPYEVAQPLPLSITCGNCKSVFSPVDELHWYTVHICTPGQHDQFIESHYSGRPFILPRRGDRIHSKYADLSANESLRVSDVEFEFHTPGDGTGASRQVVYILTETTTEGG